MTHLSIHKLLFWVNCLGIILILSNGCGWDNLASGPIAEQLLEEGWNLYEQREYTEAIDKFDRALRQDPNLVDGYNGLGWSNFALQNLAKSSSFFSQAATIDTNAVDVLVGSAFSWFERNQYNRSIEWGERACNTDSTKFDLKPIETDYTFSHNWQVTSKSLRKIIALSNYYLGNFSEAHDQLKYLNPDGYESLSPQSDSFYIDLLKELEKV